jgi:hypothetical protein
MSGIRKPNHTLAARDNTPGAIFAYGRTCGTR